MTQPGVELVTQRTPRVVAARKLLQRKYRDDQRAFLVDGPQSLREALSVGDSHPVQHVFATPDALTRHEDISQLAHARGVPIFLATAQAISSLTESVTPQGVVAVCSFIDIKLEQLPLPQTRLAVVAAQIQDPGNAGTLLRVADAAGAQAVIFTDDSVDPYNSKCVRASVGSLFHLPIVRGGAAPDVIDHMKNAGMQTLAASGHADTDLFAFADAGRLAEKTAWIFGNEAHGLPTEVAHRTDHQVAIPIYGQAESLNLATAAAICLYASARALHQP